MFSHMKLVKRAALLALGLFLFAALAAFAVQPNVRSGVSAVVDGNESEWGLVTTSANPDWFASTCSPAPATGSTCPAGTETGDLFLRFTCANHTLYVLEVARSGHPYTVGDSSNNWIKFPVQHPSPVIDDGSPYLTNTAPPMWRDLLDSKGYEAALDKDKNGANLTTTTYHIDFHAFIDRTTSGTGEQLVTLSCTPSDVTLSSMSASPVDGGVNLALVILGGLGVVALGGLVVFALSKRETPAQ